MNRLDTDIIAMCLAKGADKYVFIYTEPNSGEVLRTIGRFAANPELSFDWFDAAKISKRVREEAKEAK